MINGLFELVGSLFVLNHCRILYRDKIVRGVSLLSTMYFQAWGIWNIYFYPSLDQIYSFYGGLAITAGNTLWIALISYYIYLENKKINHGNS